MKISNNKPIQLDPIYHDPVGKPMDYRQLIEDVFVTPMLTPMVTNTPVTITQNRRPVTNDQIIDLIEACGQDAVNPSAETMAKDLFHQTLTYFNPQTNLGASEIFVGQAAAKEKCWSRLPPSAIRLVWTSSRLAGNFWQVPAPTKPSSHPWRFTHVRKHWAFTSQTNPRLTTSKHGSEPK